MAMMAQSKDFKMADLVQHDRATYVSGRGSLEPSVVFVCERPSRSDAFHRQPLRGKAGVVFEELLRRAGNLTRAQVYVTHLVPWYPPQDRSTTEAERMVGLPWLRRELRTLGSPPVVLLGRNLSEWLLQRPYANLLGEWAFSPGLRSYCLSVRHPAYGVYQRANIDTMVGQYQRITDSAVDRGEIVFSEDTDATL